MSVEYDSDNFDMEQVSGVDNPVEPGDSYDAGVGNEVRAAVPSRKPKSYTVRTRFKSVDKKTGQIVYKVVEQKSNEQRKLLKPYSYKKKK